MGCKLDYQLRRRRHFQLEAGNLPKPRKPSDELNDTSTTFLADDETADKISAEEESADSETSDIETSDQLTAADIETTTTNFPSHEANSGDELIEDHLLDRRDDHGRVQFILRSSFNMATSAVTKLLNQAWRVKQVFN